MLYFIRQVLNAFDKILFRHLEDLSLSLRSSTNHGTWNQRGNLHRGSQAPGWPRPVCSTLRRPEELRVWGRWKYCWLPLFPWIRSLFLILLWNISGFNVMQITWFFFSFQTQTLVTLVRSKKATWRLMLFLLQPLVSGLASITSQWPSRRGVVRKPVALTERRHSINCSTCP